MAASYTPEQQRVIDTALRVTGRRRSSPRERKALLAALAVESNFRDLDYGDRDSVGALQQRPSQGWGPGSESLATDVGQFLERAEQVNRAGFKGSAGSLAQAVQRSAFPERYDERGAEADALLRGVGGSRGARGGRQRMSAVAPELETGSVALAGLLSQAQGPAGPPVGSLQAPAFAARPVTPEGYQPVQSSGGGSVSPTAALEQTLAAIRESSGQSLPDVPAADERRGAGGGGGTNGGGGALAARKRLGGASSTLDDWASELEIPVTAKQEPGHASGGDHDPAVKGATARDFGGSEERREKLFRRITGALGVKDAVYKGRDINVDVNGIRYQIISRDHGSGPHLHVGMRYVGR